MKLNHLCICAPWRWFQSKQKQFDTLLVRHWCTIYINLSYPTLSSSTLNGLTRCFSACSRRKLRKHPSATRFNKTPVRPLNRRFITNMTHMTAYLLAFCFLQKADLVPSKMFYVWHRPNDLHKECIWPATEASIVALWGNLKTGGHIPTSWNHWERCVVPSFFLGFQKLPEVLGKKNLPILKSATWKLQWDFSWGNFCALVTSSKFLKISFIILYEIDGFFLPKPENVWTNIDKDGPFVGTVFSSLKKTVVFTKPRRSWVLRAPSNFTWVVC